MARLIRDDVDRFFQYNVDIGSRTIYMGSTSNVDGEESGVDYEMSEYVIKGFYSFGYKKMMNYWK